ncbi:MAG: hypothetical protein WD023_01720 [Ilumatobacteraceae bacterium]
MHAPRPRKRIDVKLLLASLGIAAGVVFIIAGLRTSVTGRDQLGLPPEIESVDPISGATQVLQQTRVFVDMIGGHEGVLVIDGVELPTVSLDDLSKTPPGLGDAAGDQIDVPEGAVFEPGNVTLTYTTQEGALVGPFATGTHTAEVIYWLAEDGRQKSRSYTWTFYVV